MPLSKPFSFLKKKSGIGAAGGKPSLIARVGRYKKQIFKYGGGGLLLVAAGFLLGGYFGGVVFDRGVPVRISKVAEINKLLQKVSRHIVINQSEDPTVASVQKPDVLRGQNPIFYKDVQAGDRLIVWSDRAILYSPKRDLVLAAMVSLVPPAPTASSTAAAPSPAAPKSAEVKSFSIEIRNGTGKAGAAKTLGDRLKANGFNVASTTSATKTFTDTTVVMISAAAKKATDADTLLPVTGGKFGDLPPGEKASTADILIILGTDQA